MNVSHKIPVLLMFSALILCLFQQAGDNDFFIQVYWVNTILLFTAQFLSSKNVSGKLVTSVFGAYYIYAFCVGICNVNFHIKDAMDAILLFSLFINTKKNIALVMSLLLAHQILLGFEPTNIAYIAELVGLMVVGSFAYELIKKQLKGAIKKAVYASLLLIIPVASKGQEIASPVFITCVTPAAITGTLTAATAATSTLSDATPGGNWLSSNTAVATVGYASGIVTGVAGGTATISYVTGPGSCFAVATFTVTAVAYATWSPTNKSNTCVLSNGNLTMKTNTSGAFGICVATVGRSSGKLYWEIKVDNLSSAQELSGIANFLPTSGNADVCGQVARSIGPRGGAWCISVFMTTFIQQGACSAIVVNDVIGYAMDFGTLTLSIYRNNALLGSASFTAGTWYPACNATNIANNGVTARFDPAQMTYSPPAGFTAGW